MSKSRPTNITASVRQRLLNVARERREEFQLLLIRYALERLLYRLSRSPHSDEFLLKGAMLFQLWTGQPLRSTLDLDLLGRGEVSVARFEAIFREVCATPVAEDGLRFLTVAIHGEEIREEQRYAGVRIHGIALLGNARIPVQIDIGFGDAVTPRPQEISYPSILGLPAPVLRAYPKETVVAEKYEAMASLGIANSRMKDFYDIWALARSFDFDGGTLSRAIRATFERRGTALPIQPPLALGPEFFSDPAKQAQWRAFARRGRLLAEPPSFEGIVDVLRSFLWPATHSLLTDDPFDQVWRAGGPWEHS